MNIIYGQCFSHIMLRVQDDGEEEEGMTLLNPGQAFVFEGGEIGLVICTHRVSQVLPELLNESVSWLLASLGRNM
jgi:hypothetical protein